MIEFIKSVSGVRGILEGKKSDTLTKATIISLTEAFIKWLLLNNPEKRSIVIGRDARKSGSAISELIISTLEENGFSVLDLGLSTTPTVALAAKKDDFSGGMMITASHNPAKWNGIKLFSSEGKGFNKKQWNSVFELEQKVNCSNNFNIYGSYTKYTNFKYLHYHIQKILELNLVDCKAILNKNLKIAIDGCNSTGGIALKMLLEDLGIKNIGEVNTDINGCFNRSPEPIPENLNDLSTFIKDNKYDIGFAVDPDTDRLAIIDENGDPWGEEFTLIAISEFILSKTPGNTVSNLSSSRALKDITLSYDEKYFASAVGEANVVEKMIETNAIIGGEGNGGVIYPTLNYCRDALVASALMLSKLSNTNLRTSELKYQLPQYEISKTKIKLSKFINTNDLLNQIHDKYQDQQIDRRDGLKIDFEDGWVHIRKSNTEPIIRIYAEAKDLAKANEFIDIVKREI